MDQEADQQSCPSPDSKNKCREIIEEEGEGQNGRLCLSDVYSGVCAAQWAYLEQGANETEALSYLKSHPNFLSPGNSRNAGKDALAHLPAWDADNLGHFDTPVLIFPPQT